MTQRRDYKFDIDTMTEEDAEKVKNNPIDCTEILYHAGWKLVYIAEEFEKRCVVLWSTTLDIHDMWNAVNYARLFTEDNHAVADSLLNDALGHIADAYYMADSLMAWGIEKVKSPETALTSIANSIRAGLGPLREAVIEIDLLIDPDNKGDANGPCSCE